MKWYYQPCIIKEKTFFNGKNGKLTKNNTSNTVLCNRIFPYYYLLLIFGKWLDFHKSWLTFSGKIFSATLLFPNLKVKVSVAEIVKTNLFKWNIFSKKTIFEYFIIYFQNQKQFSCIEYSSRKNNSRFIKI